jgi:hypothetical protein
VYKFTLLSKIVLTFLPDIVENIMKLSPLVKAAWAVAVALAGVARGDLLRRRTLGRNQLEA